MKKIESNNATNDITITKYYKEGAEKNLSSLVSFYRNSRWSPAFYEAGLLKNIDLKITNVASKCMEFFALSYFRDYCNFLNCLCISYMIIYVLLKVVTKFRSLDYLIYI